MQGSNNCRPSHTTQSDSSPSSSFFSSSFSSVTSLYSLTSSSYASSSSSPATFFFSCNTSFHPLQLSSLVSNPLPPLQGRKRIGFFNLFTLCILHILLCNLLLDSPLLILLVFCNLFPLCILIL